MDTQRPDGSGLSRRGALARLGAGGLGAALAARGIGAAAQDATPFGTAMAAPPVIQAWLDAWMSTDPAANVAALYTADGVYEDVPSDTRATGPDAIRGFLSAFLAGVSGLRIAPGTAFATADWGAAEYRFGATDQGFIPGGEGKAFDVRTVTIFELAGDKVRRSSDYFDVATILGQLGLLPSAPGTPTA